MKLNHIIILATAIMTAVTSFSEESITARDKAKRSMAMRSAAKRVLEEIDSLASDRGVDRILLGEKMTSEMSNNVQAHKALDASRSLCESVVRTARLEFFNTQLTNAVKAAQQHSPLDLEVKEVLENVGSKWTDLVDRKISEFVDGNYTNMFKNARERAVAVQRRVVDKGISYPKPEDIDKALSGLKQKAKDPSARLEHKDFKKLTGWIRGFTYKDIKSVFDENLVYVDQLGGKVLAGISGQYNTQLETIDDIATKLSASDTAVTAKGAKDEMVAAVEKFVAKQRKKQADGDVPLCDMFKAIEEEAEAEATRIEIEKYIAHIEKMQGIPISESDIEQKILANKPDYRTPKQGIDKLLYEYGVDLERFTSSSYAKKFKGKAEEYNEYFENLLKDNAAIAASYNKKIRELLSEKATPVRQKISEKEFKQYFNKLKDGTQLDEKLVEYAHDNRKRFPVKNIKSLIKMFKQAESDKLTELETANEVLLEETEQKAVSEVNNGVVTGRDALDEQVRIVHEMEKEQREELKEQAEGGKSLEKILNAWGDELDDKWKKHAKENKVVYDKVFNRASELLNKTVRQFYKSIEESQNTTTTTQADEKTSIDFIKESEASLQPSETEEEEEETPEDAAAGGGAGAKAATEEQTSEMAVTIEMPMSDADCVIVLDNSRLFKCDAKLVTKEGAELTSVRISPKKIDDASTKIHESIKESVHKILESKKSEGGKEPQLKMFVVIKSDDIRHKMSIKLMQKMRTLVEEWSEDNMPEDQPIELLWSVGF